MNTLLTYTAIAFTVFLALLILAAAVGRHLKRRARDEKGPF
jgi:hypothetical protein